MQMRTKLSPFRFYLSAHPIRFHRARRLLRSALGRSSRLSFGFVSSTVIGIDTGLLRQSQVYRRSKSLSVVSDVILGQWSRRFYYQGPLGLFHIISRLVRGRFLRGALRVAYCQWPFIVRRGRRCARLFWEARAAGGSKRALETAGFMFIWIRWLGLRYRKILRGLFLFWKYFFGNFPQSVISTIFLNLSFWQFFLIRNFLIFFNLSFWQSSSMCHFDSCP